MTMGLYYLLVLGFVALAVAGHEDHGPSFLTPLAEHVRSHSNPDVVPISGHHTPVDLQINFAVLNVATVDEDNNRVEMEGTIRFTWNTGITWDPADFGGCEFINLPKSYFWIPNLQTLTTAVRSEDLGPGIVVLFHNGTATNVEVQNLSTLCDVSGIAAGSTCHTQMSLWGYSKHQVHISSISGESADVLRYFSGSNYQITGSGINIVDYPFDGNVFQIVDFSVTIQEKPRSRPHGPYRAFFQWH